MNKAELNNNKSSILIVDDNTESLDLLSASLREQGYKVRPATSGELALKSAFNDPPDLILLDIIMPGMNGYDVCSQLKKNILTKNIPVIFLTSKEMEYDEEKGFTHGAVDYITRPFNPALLKSRINTHIELKKHRERLEELVKQKIKEIRIKNQKLQTNLNLIQTLIDTMPNPVYYKDTEGKYLGCNTSFSEKILGIPLYEFTEKKITDRSGELPRGLASLFLKQDKFLLKNPGVMNFESAVECADGKSRNYLFSNATFNDPGGKISGITGIMTDITDLTDTGMELSRINEEFDLIITSMPGMIIGVSVKDRITHWNPYTANLFGVPASDVINKRFFECGINWDWEKMYEAISECMVQGYAVRIDELFFTGPDGKNGIIEVAVNPLLRDKTDLEGFIIIGQDITEQKILEGQLLQGRKLEAIGQLAAGVAHEINTPLQYVGDNLRFLNKSFSGILNMLDIIKDVPQNSNEHEIISTSLKQVEELGTKIKLPYLLEEMPKAIEQSLEGINRVSKIIQSMKAFSHPGTGSKTLTDINHSIENTITVSRNEWKYDCDLEFNPDTDLPLVPCFEPEFNQVILNMIVNAVDAVHDAQHNGKIERGRIIIKTSYSPPNAIIIIQDNGTGIPDEIVYKVFDPFFTTKDVGKGTGQGLAISYSIITDKHGGSISIETEKGRGTAFIIKLPIDDEE